MECSSSDGTRFDFPSIGLADSYNLFDDTYEYGSLADQPAGDDKPWQAADDYKDLRVWNGISTKVLDPNNSPNAHNTRELVRPATSFILIGELALLFSGSLSKVFTIQLIDGSDFPISTLTVYAGAAEYFSGNGRVHIYNNESYHDDYDPNYNWPGNTWQEFMLSYTHPDNDPDKGTDVQFSCNGHHFRVHQIQNPPVKALKFTMAAGLPLYQAFQLRRLRILIPVEVPAPE